MQLVPEKIRRTIKARRLTEFETTDKEFQELMTEHDRFMKAEENLPLYPNPRYRGRRQA